MIIHEEAQEQDVNSLITEAFIIVTVVIIIIIPTEV